MDPINFRVLTLDDIGQELREMRERHWAGGSMCTINAVHVHHTWQPNYATWRGLASVHAMDRYHRGALGARCIAQHVTVGPLGDLWSGRPFTMQPASAKGFNGEDDGPHPFMFELVGDFDRGGDVLSDEQFHAAAALAAAVLQTFDLGLPALRFHRELHAPGHPIPKTCPGAAFPYMHFVNVVAAALGWTPHDRVMWARGRPDCPMNLPEAAVA